MTTSKELAKKLQHQTVLVDLSQLRPLSIDAALRSILTAAAHTLDVERASFWTLATDGSAIRCVQLYVSSTDSFSSGANLGRASYPSYFDALLTCQAIVANDAVRDPRTKEFAIGYFDVHGIGAMLDVRSGPMGSSQASSASSMSAPRASGPSTNKTSRDRSRTSSL